MRRYNHWRCAGQPAAGSIRLDRRYYRHRCDHAELPYLPATQCIITMMMRSCAIKISGARPCQQLVPFVQALQVQGCLL